MKINNMDKYEVTKAVKKAKDVLFDPATEFHFCGPNSDEVLEMVEEIKNPVTDKDGYVHKYYLSEDAKSFIETLIRKSK